MAKLIVVANQVDHVLFYYLKITGKAVMLDEIINYVQSLQQQVEVSNLFQFIQLLGFSFCKICPLS